VLHAVGKLEIPAFRQAQCERSLVNIGAPFMVSLSNALLSAVEEHERIGLFKALLKKEFRLIFQGKLRLL